METSRDNSNPGKTVSHSTMIKKGLAKVTPILRKKLDRGFDITDYFKNAHHHQGDT